MYFECKLIIIGRKKIEFLYFSHFFKLQKSLQTHISLKKLLRSTQMGQNTLQMHKKILFQEKIRLQFF
jgi:hypothetical protein